MNLIYFFKVIFRLSCTLFSSLMRYKYVFLTKVLELYYYFKESEIPKVNFENVLFGEEFYINKEEHKKSNMSELESRVLANLMHHFKPNFIFEMGTFNGFSTLNFAMNTPEETIIYTLDLPKEFISNTGLKVDINELEYINKSTSGAFFKDHPISRKITQLYGDTYNFDFTPYYEKLDLVFIDASHTYKYVSNDTEIALKLLKKKGGVILWHDYNSVTFTGVTRYLNEKYNGDSKFNEMKLIKGTSLVILRLENES